MAAKTIKIAPSILSADFRCLEKEILLVEKAGADLIHCDVMDGHFVPNITFGPFVVEAVKKCATVPLDVHLMITNPADYITAFRKAGADIITIHAEVCPNLPAVLAAIRASGARVGVTVNPDKPVELFLPYLDRVDQALIMSVFAGFSGQKFIAETMSKVAAVSREAARIGREIDIQVDGGITDATIGTCVQHGANVFVAGSYVYNGSDYSSRIEALRQNAHKALQS
jgi:ribulose-phosphate 3-epimerase